MYQCVNKLAPINKVEGPRQGSGASRAYYGESNRLQETPQIINREDVSARKFQRWVPPSTQRHSIISDYEKHNIVFRRCRGILNKIAPEKFDKLCNDLLNVGIDSKAILKGIILLIFDKALEEAKYSFTYAQLCKRLCELAPNFEPPGSSGPATFQRLLIAKCQDEFENRSKAFKAYDRDGYMDMEEEEQRHVAKLKMLGNIKFICELGKLDMLHESILHRCIKQLLDKKKHESIADRAEDLECLCQIMKTIGRRLDTKKAKALMDQYFERMNKLSVNYELPARIRFMLQDCLELRNNEWMPRRVMRDQGPKLIEQVRQEAARDLGIYIPSKQTDFFSGINGDRGFLGRGQPRGGLNDVFIQGPMGSSVGTGPGVIDLDPYGAGSYSPKTRQRNFNRDSEYKSGGYSNNYSQYGNQGRQRQQNQNPSPTYGNQGQQQYQSQSQSYQQRQSQENSGFGQTRQNTQSRDMPPRFSKGGDEVSLRPNQSIILKPQSLNMLPSSTKKTNAPLAKAPQSLLKPQVPMQMNPSMVPIKQVAIQEKPKPVKKRTNNKKDVLTALELILQELDQTGCIEDATKSLKEKVQNKFVPAVVCAVMKHGLPKTDTERDMLSTLIASLKKENIVNATHFMEGFTELLSQLAMLEVDYPLIKSSIGTYAARAVIDDVVALSELCDPMENGAYYPLIMLCLQRLQKLKDKEWLVKLVNESKINLLKMLPEIDQNKEKMIEILDGKNLSFLFPLLRLQGDIWKQIKSDPNPQTLYKWIKDSVDPSLHKEKGFINALTTGILKYVTQESSLQESVDLSVVPEKVVQEKEKVLLDKFKPLLQRFVHENVNLQMVALYALQTLCFQENFPKGMLLRFFVNLYDMEVIDEEAFLNWKEDVTDEFNGKGEALFQVNQWLTWLATAEEEESEEEED
ncbi:eukaryotic translation initiation factor 4 gamma 2-like [Antedon mediterranea]|uniref:eukaryotic translation initiation factor 4 gamma 2-like n=1 Tax=Antedon mediterranea TaxID=105859 RepID=UPI003AF42CD7